MDLETFISELSKNDTSEIEFYKLYNDDDRYEHIEISIYSIDIKESSIILNLTIGSVSESLYPTSHSLIETLKGLGNNLSVMVKFIGNSTDVIDIGEDKRDSANHTIIIF